MKTVATIIIFTLILSGCKTKTVYVPIESVKTEYHDNYIRDSVHLYDSVFVLQKGDTVWLEKYKYLYRDKLIRDSIFVHDSIPYIKEVAVKGDIVYKMKWYEKIFFFTGLASILLGAGYGLVSIIKKRIW